VHAQNNNNFSGSGARQTQFAANANQSNESVTVVKMNFYRGKKSISKVVIVHFFPLCHPQTTMPATRAQVEIDFYCCGN